MYPTELFRFHETPEYRHRCRLKIALPFSPFIGLEFSEAYTKMPCMELVADCVVWTGSEFLVRVTDKAHKQELPENWLQERYGPGWEIDGIPTTLEGIESQRRARESKAYFDMVNKVSMMMREVQEPAKAAAVGRTGLTAQQEAEFNEIKAEIDARLREKPPGLLKSLWRSLWRKS